MISLMDQGLLVSPADITYDAEFTEREESLFEIVSESTTGQCQDPRRWAVLGAFSLVTFSSALAWITFAPRANGFAKYYGLSSNFYIDTLSTIYMVTYPLFLLPALSISDYFCKKELENSRSLVNNTQDQIESISSCASGYGLRGSIVTAIFLHVAGCWIRYFGGNHFSLAWLGQAVASLCQVFTLGMPPKLSSIWFNSDEQNIAISIGVTSNILGSSVGFLLTPFAVDSKNLDQTIPNYLYYQAICFSFLAAAIFFLFPAAPRTPQSKYDHHEPSADTIPTVIGNLFKVPGFFFLAMSYGLVVGSQYAVQTLLTSIILPVFSKKSEIEIGWLGFWMLIFGIITSLIGGIYLDSTKRYVSFSIILYIATILSLLSMNIALEKTIYFILCAGSLVYGMASAALTPSLFQYAMVYFNKGDDEATITGLLNCMAQIVGVIFITLMAGIESENNEKESPKFTMRVPSWFLLSVTFIGLPLLLISQKRMV